MVIRYKMLVFYSLMVTLFLFFSSGQAHARCYCSEDPGLGESSCAYYGYHWVCESEPPIPSPPSGPTAAELAAIAARNAAIAAKKAEEERLAAEKAKLEKIAAEKNKLLMSEQAMAVVTVDRNSSIVRQLGRLTNERSKSLGQGKSRIVISQLKIKPALSTPILGMAAGDTNRSFGAWIAPSGSRLDSDRAASEYDGSLVTLMTGLDFKIAENLLVGLSMGYDHTDLDTAYNNGSFKSKGYTIGPYVGYAITDHLVLDAMLAYTFLNNDVDRNRSTDRITGDYDSRRWMFSTNINYLAMYGNWNFSALAGYMYVSENQDAYTESGGENFTIEEKTSYLGEWRFGGRAGYLLENLEPYIAAAYLYDNTWNSNANDRDELEGTIGVNYFPTTGFILSLEATHSFFRDDFSNTRVLLNLHYDF
jgi:outer membrane autotransporter protein